MRMRARQISDGRHLPAAERAHAEVQLGGLLHAGRGRESTGAASRALPGSHDSAHAHFSQSGYLRRGGIVGQNDCSRRRKERLALSRLLARTKSEIVVPVFVHGKVAGELDIDSHFAAAFGEEDRKLVEHCAQLWASEWRKTEPSQLLASGC